MLPKLKLLAHSVSLETVPFMQKCQNRKKDCFLKLMDDSDITNTQSI